MLVRTSGAANDTTETVPRRESAVLSIQTVLLSLVMCVLGSFPARRYKKRYSRERSNDVLDIGIINLEGDF